MSLSLTFVAGCCRGRAENPECIAPEEADRGASQGGGRRADDGQREEPTAASTLPARQHTASAEGAYLLMSILRINIGCL